MTTFFRSLYRKLKDHPLPVGTIINEAYRITGHLGAGSFGLAYIAVQSETDSPCVLKQLRPSRSKMDDQKQFLHEVDVLKMIHHPAVPRYLDHFTNAGRTFIAMTYVEGENLEDVLFDQKRAFSEKESLKLITDVVGVVADLHLHEVFHGDLRTPNMILRHGALSIIDFGLARTGSQGLSEEQKTRHALEDLYDAGDLLLFLLYSTFQTKRKKALPWTEELTLHPATTTLLKRLLGIDQPFHNAIEAEEALKSTLTMVRA
ncbi:serine/threonine protein kinase [Aureibacillus halotolerans]|uniref:non-specific serine/threonine protein kinase n=1 Tax=Aureibacillus halotolerans TaxID=1508390 RepID=A0A4R6TW70_9BACI|nr:protein kinase [Aureibacillus halotolerans]TDQ36075.1 serine/threonine-protein kinase [Aureibacillus halotolerans]